MPLKKTNPAEILDLITEGVVLFKSGKIVFSNRNFSELCNIPKKKLAGMDFVSFVSPDDRHKVGSFLNRLSLSVDFIKDRTEFLLIGSTGKEYLVEMNAKTVPDNENIDILASLVNVTERKKTRKELKKLLDTIPEVILMTSPEDNTRIINISSATEKLFAIPAKEFITGGLHVFDIVLPEDKDRVIAFYKNIDNQEFDSLEYRIVSADSHIKWVNDSAEVIYKMGGRGKIEKIMHFIRDITERKKYTQSLTSALESLRISEQRYRDIIETTTDAIFIVTPKGKFKQINPAGIKFFGFENLEKALNSNINDYYVDLKQRIHIIETIKTRGQITGYPVRMKTICNEIREVTITAGAKKNKETGDLESYQAIIHDITLTLHKKEIETYRRTMKGLADSINNLAQTYFSFLGLMKENLEDLRQNPEILDTTLKEVMEDIAGFRISLKRLARLGEIARDSYSTPPEVSPDGSSSEGMYYFETIEK